MVLVVLALCGYLAFDKFFLNRQSDLDKKSKEEQSQAILSNEEYKDFPEVAELKKQVEGISEGTSQENGQGKSLDNEGIIPPTQAEIEADLKQKLIGLHNEYNSKLAGLANAAKQEFNQLESGQKRGSKKALVEKYFGMAESLEAQCDARVYAAINYTENELQKYGYQSDFPAQAREVYLKTKKERRQHFLSKL